MGCEGSCSNGSQDGLFDFREQNPKIQTLPYVHERAVRTELNITVLVLH